jgi:hypothetical protein
MPLLFDNTLLLDGSMPFLKQVTTTVVNNQSELNDLIDLIAEMEVNQFKLLYSSLLPNLIYNRRLNCVD